MNKQFLQFTALLLFSLTATTASAHTGSHEVSGFLSGLSHPFLGLDHLAVMLGVGLWASRLPRQQAGFTVAAFLSFMSIGAGLALFGVALQGVELGILASVLITGLLLASARQFSSVLITALFASFALLHGYAHGLEMPQAAQSAHYAAGFLLATALLHGIGLSLGAVFNKQLRILGFITSGLGLWLLINA